MAGAGLISYFGLKWIKLNSAPDFDLLANKQLIASLADTIVPKTNAPSASECNVQDFIIKMVTESTDTRTQNNFMEGLAKLEEYSKSTYNKSYVDCSQAERKQVMSYFSTKDNLKGIAGKVQKRILGKSFYTTLREYTVIGYFTSEPGATIALRYSHIPVKYIACQPYAVGEKAWATY